MANRLGKGLGALLGDEATSSSKSGLTNIEITKIKPNPVQARKTFSEQEIEELSFSIKEHGIIQPILVNEQNGKYLIVAGERRYRAAKKAGLKNVPCIIKDFNEQELMEVSLIENLQRVDLSPIEEAKGIADLMEKCNLTQEQAAIKLGKNRSSIANILRLLSLPIEVVNMIEAGKISKGHAKCLLSINDKEYILFLAKKVSQENLSVRQLEKLIAMGEKSIKEEKPKIILPEIIDFEDKLTSIFGAKVKIVGNEKKGSIKIDYNSLEELNYIFDTVKDLV